ncbi:zinc-ribbon domain-containing protein [Salipiger aestuarii]|uniref:Putative Zn finger-like uncharacterized protein n=1 Tax=Salipiger aestuarii TaxID=568098 RepID=A0A327YLV5_9RHOB|nr:zinc-ribbon domain-containing protein [Salipiger aestuarii]EIE48858.1 hypothetical protein C357_21900 [Citreicella sp. 357]KAA8616402.1 hypothetical protein AL037_00430 [Salipiger aestuarii]KAB2543503.1 hypothetical protein AL035_01560 [Salipiger aestuarii]RAK21930.1 putative Zn finger-like uncharacterized protein [Salipiger aestuarii]
MRLICPNCGAQYEVPSNVIPTGGRDVQCSSCGHTWFQAHPQDDDVPPRPDDWDTGPDRDEDPEPDTAPPVPAPDRKPRSLDPSVIEVLREEADREARQRAAETGALETQPDLGLAAPQDSEAARRARDSRERTVEEKSDSPAPAPLPDRIADGAVTAGAAAGSRRELLPDIEEINQTLRASPGRRGDAQNRDMTTPQGRAATDEDIVARRSGFSAGFRTVILIAVLAIALYVMAPTLVDMAPALGAVLNPYVDAIDAARLWLDGQIVALLQMLDGYSSEAAAQ